mmetsp:Transcript_15485/g.35452  ORF Transcript_15485/g.35452 Transcript_15485/m.35452 type:complete len:266 (-) Transcript_15485:1198-1995(-)
MSLRRRLALVLACLHGQAQDVVVPPEFLGLVHLEKPEVSQADEEQSDLRGQFVDPRAVPRHVRLLYRRLEVCKASEGIAARTDGADAHGLVHTSQADEMATGGDEGKDRALAAVVAQAAVLVDQGGLPRGEALGHKCMLHFEDPRLRHHTQCVLQQRTVAFPVVAVDELGGGCVEVPSRAVAALVLERVTSAHHFDGLVEMSLHNCDLELTRHATCLPHVTDRLQRVLPVVDVQQRIDGVVIALREDQVSLYDADKPVVCLLLSW